jgi:hypothetical protein
VIDAALCGHEYSRLAKILNKPEHRRFNRARRPIRILRETEVATLYYVEMIAKSDLVAIYTASSVRNSHSFGGTRSALGTNPILSGRRHRGARLSSTWHICVHGNRLGVPRTARLMAARRRGGRCQGRPPRDPTMARLEALLPFGGLYGLWARLCRAGVGVLAASALDPYKEDG